MSRRDFTRLTAVAGGLVWATPKLSTIRFADKIVGSHVPTTTTTEEPPPPTTTSTKTTTTTAPTTTTSTTIGQQGSTTTTTHPNGTTTTTLGQTGNTTTTVCRPGHGFGDENHCHTGPPGQVKGASAQNSNTGSGDPNGGTSSGGTGLGSLSFTGADSADLAIFGATAVVVGRALYAFGRRKPQAETPDGPEEGDGVTPE
jgi:hypothetical protein